MIFRFYVLEFSAINLSSYHHRFYQILLSFNNKCFLLESMTEAYHWNIVVTNKYPFDPPKVYNLNNICHPEIDRCTGELMIAPLTLEWSSAFNLITVVRILHLFIAGKVDELSSTNLLMQTGDFKSNTQIIDTSAFKSDMYELGGKRKREYIESDEESTET